LIDKLKSTNYKHQYEEELSPVKKDTTKDFMTPSGKDMASPNNVLLETADKMISKKEV